MALYTELCHQQIDKCNHQTQTEQHKAVCKGTCDMHVGVSAHYVNFSFWSAVKECIRHILGFAEAVDDKHSHIH